MGLAGHQYLQCHHRVMEFFRVCYLDECNHAIMQMHRLHQPDELQEKETKFQPCYWISNNPHQSPHLDEPESAGESMASA